tara:strand:+ start:331 stop:525 length:195 start_codon:yes stop_codon:yes gene_type:complete
MEHNIENLVAFIQNKIKGNVKDNDYINLMLLVSKIYIESKKDLGVKDEDESANSYTDEYIEEYT